MQPRGGSAGPASSSMRAATDSTARTPAASRAPRSAASRASGRSRDSANNAGQESPDVLGRTSGPGCRRVGRSGARPAGANAVPTAAAAVAASAAAGQRAKALRSCAMDRRKPAAERRLVEPAAPSTQASASQRAWPPGLPARAARRPHRADAGPPPRRHSPRRGIRRRLENTRAPPASVARYAALRSPPGTGSSPTTSSPSAAASASLAPGRRPPRAASPAARGKRLDQVDDVLEAVGPAVIGVWDREIAVSRRVVFAQQVDLGRRPHRRERMQGATLASAAGASQSPRSRRPSPAAPHPPSRSRAPSPRPSSGDPADGRHATSRSRRCRSRSGLAPLLRVQPTHDRLSGRRAADVPHADEEQAHGIEPRATTPYGGPQAGGAGCGWWAALRDDRHHAHVVWGVE